MTEIAFHFNAPDRLSYVCRLLRKAVAGGSKVVVTGAAETLEQLDTALWAVSSVDFVPHCVMGAQRSVLENSPVVLAQSLQTLPFSDILVNLGDAVPVGFEQFSRLIEVVTLDELDRKLARGRWKYYADGGFHLIRHDLQKANS